MRKRRDLSPRAAGPETRPIETHTLPVRASFDAAVSLLQHRQAAFLLAVRSSFADCVRGERGECGRESRGDPEERGAALDAGNLILHGKESPARLGGR